MTTFAAGQAKNSFGTLLDTAQREAVTIERNGHAVAVVLSKYAFDVLQEELRTYRSQVETDFLMRGENGKRLARAIERHKNGEPGIVKTIEELEAMVSDEG